MLCMYVPLVSLVMTHASLGGGGGGGGGRGRGEIASLVPTYRKSPGKTSDYSGSTNYYSHIFSCRLLVTIMRKLMPYSIQILKLYSAPLLKASVLIFQHLELLQRTIHG